MPFNSKWERESRADWVRSLKPGGKMLEIGARMSESGPASYHNLCRDIGISYESVDLEPGFGIQGDIHDLRGKVADSSYDYVVSEQVFEHLRKPWVAASEIARITKDGGLVRTVVPQTYHIHDFPGDYFRFSEAALASLFDFPDWEKVATGCAYPCSITASKELIEEIGWSQGGGQAFLAVWGVFRRTR